MKQSFFNNFPMEYNTEAPRKKRHKSLSISDLAKELDEAWVIAEQGCNPIAMIQATMSKAKLLGLIVDKREITNQFNGPIQTITKGIDAKEASIIYMDLIKKTSQCD